MWATCFIGEVMNVARHSHRGCRRMRIPRHAASAARLNGSEGKAA